MLQGNYEQIVVRIARSANLDADEVKKRVEAKQAKLSNLISKEGAAQIIAAELGISLEKEQLKISELLPGMKRVNFIGQILQVFPVREFNKNGKEGKVLNFRIADETGNTKVVLWDVNHISLFEKGEIGEGHVIEIINGSMREGEAHLGSFSELKKSSIVLTDLKTKAQSVESKIVDIKPGMNVKSRAVIVQMFDPKYFDVCPECGKKAVAEADGNVCITHGKVIPKKRALITIVIDDGTESIKGVMFNEAIEKAGISLEGDFAQTKSNLLGKEMVFVGSARQNKFFNNTELIINEASEVDIDAVIAQLEGK